MRKYSFLRYGVMLLVILTIGAVLGYHQITPIKIPKDFQEHFYHSTGIDLSLCSNRNLVLIGIAVLPVSVICAHEAVE